jgi:hypothetical protein
VAPRDGGPPARPPLMNRLYRSPLRPRLRRGLRSASWSPREKGQGWGRGHTWRCECGYKTPARPRRPLIYTIYPVIFTVYIYRVITLGRSVSREGRGGGPVSLFHSPTFQAWFNHDPHRYEYRLPRFMTRYAMHRSHLSKQHLPQPSQAVKCDTRLRLVSHFGHVRHFVSHTSAACPAGLRQDEGNGRSVAPTVPRPPCCGTGVAGVATSGILW